MEDLHNVGGIPAVMKYMLKEGMLHGDCLTVTGKTIAENLADVPDLKEGQDVIMPKENPIKETGHLRMLFGNLAEGGSVAKITGKEGFRFSGPARVFNGEYAANDGILEGKVKKEKLWSFGMKDQKAVPVCPKCSNLPPLLWAQVSARMSR